MPDRFSREQRRAVMARVRNRNTTPELVVRRLLHAMGYRFRLHRRDLPGSPDIVLPKYHTAIFVHGCFWHGHPGCPRAARPTTNVEFWNRKLDTNLRRDAQVREDLERLGWQVVVVWECETRDLDALRSRFVDLVPPSVQ